MGVKLEYHLEGAKELREYLKRIAQNIGDPKPFFKAAGLVIMESVNRNFEEGGRPKWKPLAPATIKRRRGSGDPQPLRDTGLLMTSIGKGSHGVMQTAKDHLLIGTNRPGAAVNQETRPFMMLQPADEETLLKLAGDMAMRGTG